MKRALSVHMQLVQCDIFSRFFDGIYEKYVDSIELCYRHIIGDVTNIQYQMPWNGWNDTFSKLVNIQYIDKGLEL